MTETPEVILGKYIACTADRPLPADVAEKAKCHLVDTIAAIISGQVLPAGRAGACFAAARGGSAEATLLATGKRISAIWAAFGNAMAAHADETDDSHLEGRFHPGCGVVPTALAAAEANGRNGAELLRAIVAGYDIGARAVMALNLDPNRRARFSTHSIGANFGAAAAAAALWGLTPRQCQWTLSYAVQQCSGVPSWRRDTDHVEKAFDFCGMAARNAITSALMVSSGWTGVDDAMAGEDSFLTAFSDTSQPDQLTAALGRRFEIMRASIKKWCVGSPNQSPLDALETLMRKHKLGPDSIARMRVTMPDDRLHLVDNSDMPSVCLQHLLALLLMDGTLGFDASHDATRMQDHELLAIRSRIEVIPSRELTQARPARQAIVEIETPGGELFSHRVIAVKGTPDAPMDRREVCDKARDLMIPILGRDRVERLLAELFGIDDDKPIDSIFALLRTGSGD